MKALKLMNAWDIRVTFDIKLISELNNKRDVQKEIKNLFPDDLRPSYKNIEVKKETKSQRCKTPLAG